MSIARWPRDDRPSEKLVARGPAALSDAELLAVFLSAGCRGSDPVAFARSLLARFGGLRALLSAGRGEICAAKGLGPARYALLQAALELGRRHLAERLCRDGPLTDPRRASAFIASRIRDRSEEHFCCLYLDARHYVIAFEELFRGSVDGAAVHPRVVIKRALHNNAAALIVAHNHPSGIAEPSGADEALTRRLRDALALVDVRLLDHLIIGDGECVSLSERGLV